MVRILFLIVAAGLTASSNGSREFVFNVGVLKTLLTTEADLIDRIIDDIAQQRQHLKTISNEEVYSKELEDVAHKANEYLSSAKTTTSMLTGLETLWPKIDAYVKETTEKIGLKNVTSAGEPLIPEYAYNDYEYGIFDNSALKLCNGMISLSPDIEKQLRCRFVDHGNPFLRIAPFKQEDVYLDPFIVIYHNVLTDAEVEMLQEEGYPALESSKVIAYEQGLHSSKIRISENAWLYEDIYPKVQSINERAGHITNLNVHTAEALQIAYYKPGGYFNEHYDFDHDQENPFPTFGFGNRVGTLMFYLNDVQEGGRTIFTDLNVSLTPKKGNAVFWFNTLPNGHLDYYTVHAGCRVVSGVKWVANKWFHEQGQEFLRPCLLKNVYDKKRNSP
ncbi:prolyl 4-hydroxylase subunit alpha-2-like [Leptopilina heterotoma]|uniref:prolyl 4-hydroxylase subunit alpha-2-like n=1 Tax=Leptopilina heterotoma TaxID=63436 RepID=UPI001CA9CFE0|nr:prolyl 4-hydroxylase subunit alpha-2-like [Leptopilina heterotoma]XP_043465897.1 prolyl 4-hydroxylase subunit alpha-2-like [Leptopilina heterotoma]